jgi:hypothetical protein
VGFWGFIFGGHKFTVPPVPVSGVAVGCPAVGASLSPFGRTAGYP